MTITLDAWQPILVAIITALATIAVPVVTSILSRRDARKARLAADSAASAATEIVDKVDSVSEKLDRHAAAVSQMGTKLNGERTALLEKLARMERELIDERKKSRKRTSETDGG